MSAPPQINGELLSVLAVGLSEDYNQAASSASPPKWQGVSGIYVDDRLHTVYGGAGGRELDRVRQVVLYLNSDLPVEGDLLMGDTLVYSYLGVTYTARIQRLTSPEMPGAPAYTMVQMEAVNAT